MIRLDRLSYFIGVSLLAFLSIQYFALSDLYFSQKSGRRGCTSGG